ncbi:lysozyme inhibitor LprI family protein [Rhizobium halophilum]|uniref:lysozyme inhibitor LprI family protein n=1 Tax=Rhizobium halophilum TaxID=2846852 RepID=UPI0021D455AA|nr:lysozyme inhibitor LprI family protein [Rhizobium halophilum]
MCGCVLLTEAPVSAQDDPEVDCEKAVTQMEMTFCAEQDFAEADDRLNAQYKLTREAMKDWDSEADGLDLGSAANALLASQRAWLAFRDAQCAFHGYQARGGTMEPMLIYGCQAELTRQRTQQLKEQTDLMGGN